MLKLSQEFFKPSGNLGRPVTEVASLRNYINNRSFKRREENQLDTTEWFTALIMCSTCFGHLYAHHQELETILGMLPHMVGWSAVRSRAAGYASGMRETARAATLLLTADHQQPSHYTPYAVPT